MASPSPSPAEISFGRITVEPAARRVLVDDRPAHLGTRAFDLLAVLISHRDRVLAKRELLDLVWPGVVVEENNLQVQVSALRKLLGAQAIVTVPGRGYAFAPAVEVHVASGPPAASSLLHAPLTPMRGRSQELATIVSLLGDERLVTITGPGGVGKSRLAHEALRSLRLRPSPARVVNLADVTNRAGVVRRLAPPADALPGGIVLVENAEHIAAAVRDEIEAGLERDEGLRVLVTSQVPVKAHGEHVVRLAPLPVSADPSNSPSWLLFRDTVAALDPRFTPSLADMREALVICRRLDGLPLAIELAAERVPVLGTAGVRERLAHRFRLLVRGDGIRHARHASLRSCLDWSWRLLSPVEREVLRVLPRLPARFSLKAAQLALAGRWDEWQVLDHLAALVDKSLLIAGPQPHRFALLESTRQYLADLPA